MLSRKQYGEAAMYVVYLEPPKGERPFEKPYKAFSGRPSAISFANEQVAIDAEKALIFEVPDTDDARKAIAAVGMAAATLIDARVSKASDAELKRSDEKAWERAQKLGPDAMLKYLGLL
jgi:hypothetical protein